MLFSHKAHATLSTSKSITKSTKKVVKSKSDAKPTPASSSSSSSSSTPSPDAVKSASQFNIPRFHMGEVNPFSSSGFSGFEHSHRWTEGTEASITLPLAEMASPPSSISFFNTKALVTGSHTQDLIVKVNGKRVRRIVYTVDNNDQTIEIPLPKADEAKIEFVISKAISPFDLWGSTDKRKLGISFRDVQFQTSAPAATQATTSIPSAKPATQAHPSVTSSSNQFITKPLRKVPEPLKASGGEKTQESETTSANPWGIKLRATTQSPASEKVQASETTSANPWGVKLRPTAPTLTPAATPAITPILTAKPASSPLSSTSIPAPAAKSVSQPAPTPAPAVKPVTQPAPTPAPAAKPASQFNIPRFHMGEVTPFSSSGFSAFERSLRWTEGTEASIIIPLAEMASPPSRISFFHTKALVTGSHTQDLIVKVNGKEVRRIVYTTDNNDQTIDIPLPKADQAKIEFEIPDAASPLDLGIGADKRKLGISFREVQLQTSAPDVTLTPAVKPAATSAAAKPASSASSSTPSSSSSISIPAPNAVKPVTQPASTPAPAAKPASQFNIPRFHMGEINPFSSSGFSGFEHSHRWTEGTEASIILPLAEMASPPSRISFFDTRALVTGSHTQDLIVKVNGKEVRRIVYTTDNNNQTIDIPLPKADQAKIEFVIPDAASPLELGIAADKRKLGISFREVQFQTSAPDVTSTPAVKPAVTSAAAPAAKPASLSSSSTPASVAKPASSPSSSTPASVAKPASSPSSSTPASVAKPASSPSSSTPALDSPKPSGTVSRISKAVASNPLFSLVKKSMKGRRGSWKDNKNKESKENKKEEVEELSASSLSTNSVSADIETLLTSTSPVTIPTLSSVENGSKDAGEILLPPPPPPPPPHTMIPKTMSLPSVEKENLADSIRKGRSLRKTVSQRNLSSVAQDPDQQITRALDRSLSMMRLPIGAPHDDNDSDWSDDD
ncbi:MAG: hypothetical protein K2X02_07180 [Alphaproteobacteria bacterium]|nr:hypothetical protein [Alphaproteobacteria bacterium]